jgi:polysaccharide biosynthesis/export protein
MNRFLVGLSFVALLSSSVSAQTATGRPANAQAQAAASDPATRARILAQIKASGMSPDQIRSRLKAMGYSDDVIKQLSGGGTDSEPLTDDVFAALRSLGIMDSTVVDSLHRPVAMRRQARLVADSALLDTIGLALRNDSVRAAIQRLLASPAARRVGLDSGFTLFGRDVFNQTTKQFDPAVSGPLPPNYRVGFGDEFMLVLTGDLERTEELTVTRAGSVVLRDAGQVPVANLTFDQLRATIGNRLGQVYSGIRSGSTQFSILPTKVGTNQVFVLGDVRAPNAYQISRLGTVLTALYAAGGPTEKGDARNVDVRRGNIVIATLDLYDYLLFGSSASDVRLENGDVVFVRPQGPRVRVSGAVIRPATYELKAGQTLADAIRMAGGYRAQADRRRVQVVRFVPPARRTSPGQDKEVLDFALESPDANAGSPSARLEAGDVVVVHEVDERISNKVAVIGNVWAPATIALTADMKLSDALAKAGGPKPDTYLGVVQVSRLQPDSTRQLLRVALDRNYRPVEDILLSPDDEIRAFSLTEYRTQRYVSIGGAVRVPGNVPYQAGMTLRDLILLSGGLLESALLSEVEIASLPMGDRSNRITAMTRRVPLDSSYLLDGTSFSDVRLPSGDPARRPLLPEVVLQPYDAVTVLEQPGFSYQRTVWIGGEVKYAGEYALKTKDDRLYDLIQRAGGLTPDAYAEGILFTRQQDSVGRIGVDLGKVLKNPKDLDNILLASGDSILIPPYSPIVTVRGAVNSPEISVAYAEGASIDYYISAAGGGNTKSDEGHAYVVQPNGKVETRKRVALLLASTPRPRGGSTVVVPEKDPSIKHDWVGIAQTTLSLLASLVTVAVLVKNTQQP